MIKKKFLISLSIVSYLVSIVIFIRMFVKYKVFKSPVGKQQDVLFRFKKVNESFVYTSCGEQLAHQFGFKPEYIIGKKSPFYKSVLSESTLLHVLSYYELAWKGESVTFEIKLVNDEFIIVNLRPFLQNGQVVEVVGSIIDTTALKRVEEELWTTELESFIHHTEAAAISIINLEGHVLQINKDFEEIFGWSKQEIVGQKLPFIPKSLMNEVQKLHQKVISGESITGLETVRKRKDGSFIEVSLTLSPIRDSQENVIAFSSIIRDISERKKAEKEIHQLHQKLMESEMKYHVLFEQAIDAVYLVELDEDRFPLRFLEVNPVGCERFECSKEYLLSRQFVDIVSPNSRLIIRAVEKIREGKRNFTLQDEYMFKNGKKMSTEWGVCVFYLGEKEVLLAIARDITERLKTEEWLRKSEKLAVVGQLATAIAHEIRNPLTSMKGFMQLLKLKENEANQRYIDLVLKEIDRIEYITNEFLAVAKPQVLKIQPKNMHILVEQVTLLLQPQALMNNVQIKTEFESDLPLIPCEENQLKQVFINILKNAIEAMPLGGNVLIQVNKLDDHQLCIRFIDKGCGIPKERIPYIGEPFYSIKEKGIGLGLMICYKIIEAHQGKMFIESELDKGTTVDIILPTNLIP